MTSRDKFVLLVTPFDAAVTVFVAKSVEAFGITCSLQGGTLGSCFAHFD